MGLLIYLIVVFIGYGAVFARWQRGYPELAKDDLVKDIIVSLVFSLSCTALLMILFDEDARFKHGFLWLPEDTYVR